MKRQHLALLVAIGWAGCKFEVNAKVGIPEEVPAGGDLATQSPSGADLATAVSVDLAADDLASAPDLQGTDDLPPAPPDMTPSGFPSELPYCFLSRSTADIVITQDTTINTGDTATNTVPTISVNPQNIAVNTAPGCAASSSAPVLIAEGRFAVFMVHSLDIGVAGALPNYSRLTVTGRRPLAIVAGDHITIVGVLAASANGPIPGPGGGLPASAPSERAGLGGVGTTATGGAGGAGGGYGAVGGAGGADGTIHPAGGSTFGDGDVTELFGGAGGGNGSEPVGDPCTAARGGGGGGAIQLTARNAVRLGPVGGIISPPLRGIIALGGGFGSPGCASTTVGGSGAGGGSGGALRIEAPSVDIQAGLIEASGGGGGGGATRAITGSGFFAQSGEQGNNGADTWNINAYLRSSAGGQSGPVGSQIRGSGDNDSNTNNYYFAGDSVPRNAFAGGALSNDGTRTQYGGGGGGGQGRVLIRSRMSTSHPSLSTPHDLVYRMNLPATLP